MDVTSYENVYYISIKKQKESGKFRSRLQFENAALFLLPWSLRFFCFMREPGSGEHESLSRGCLTRKKINKNLSPNQGISTLRPSMLPNPSRKRTLSKRREGFENATFYWLYCGRKTFENAWSISKTTESSDNYVISLPEFSSNTNPKWPLIVVLSIFHCVV